MKRAVHIIAVAVLCVSTIPAQGQDVVTDEGKSFAAARGVLVPPVAKSERENLVDIGVVNTNGFSKLTLNLTGECTDVLRKGGTIGAILIPAVEPYEIAFRDHGLLPAPLEIAVNLTMNGPTEFIARQVRLDAGFPRYRVLLYNTTSNAANIAFTVYRSNE